MKTLSNLLNGILHFGFTVLLKNWQRKIRRRYLPEEKNRRKAKQSYHNNIYRWKMDSFPSEVEVTRGIIWIKIFKKENFKRRSNEFNWDKLPD